MERERYVQELETKNGYCNCSDLSNLFTQRKKTEQLEQICDSFRNKLDLENPATEELPSLLIYRRTAQEFKEEVKKYHEQINVLLKREKLKLILHNEKRHYSKREINSIKAMKLLEEQKIITIHCSYCNQQIDLAE